MNVIAPIIFMIALLIAFYIQDRLEKDTTEDEWTAEDILRREG